MQSVYLHRGMQITACRAQWKTTRVLDATSSPHACLRT